MTDSSGKQCLRIGLISDTHGLYRPGIADIFAGVEAIFHAGDIGKPAVLAELQKIAPVTAVLGNVDLPAWFPGIGRTAMVEVAGKRFLVLHNIDELDLDPKATGIDAVIFGHSHKPSCRERRGVCYINPGSAGPPRFGKPVCVGILMIGETITLHRHSIEKKC